MTESDTALQMEPLVESDISVLGVEFSVTLKELAGLRVMTEVSIGLAVAELSR